MRTKKLLTVELELQNLSAKQLNLVIQKQKGHSKIDEQIKKSPYNWIIHHPQVLQSPIGNDCLKLKIDGYTEPKIVPKLLLKVSV